jgi:hypothetical protein
MISIYSFKINELPLHVQEIKQNTYDIVSKLTTLLIYYKIKFKNSFIFMK